MKPRLFQTASFRFTCLSAAVFALSALLFSIFVYYSVRNSMEQQLRDHVVTETTQLLGDYGDHGIDELRHDIGERMDRAPSPRLLYTLVNADGEAVFDRLALPAADGWSQVSGHGGPDRLLLTTSLEDGFRLGVAADMRSIAEFGGAFRQVTMLALGAMLSLSIVAALIVSRRFLARVERFKDTAELVGAGSLASRIPIAGIGDDFEQLALTINRMLDRIERLVHDVRFVSVGIAHDLRTPLGRLRQRLEKLESLQASEETRVACQGAIELLENTLATFSSLLRIAELESGSTAIEHERIDLSTFLGRLHEVYAPIAEDRGQRLILRTDGNAIINGDRQLLTQLFANLIENAVNHNRDGVEIELLVSSNADRIEVAVADNGVGVPGDLREDVLKPFYKIEPSRRTSGSGLGLSLAARIASRHNASMRMEDNRPGLRVVVSFGTSTSVPRHA